MEAPIGKMLIMMSGVGSSVSEGEQIFDLVIKTAFQQNGTHTTTVTGIVTHHFGKGQQRTHTQNSKPLHTLSNRDR